MTADRPATEPRTEAGRDTLADSYFAPPGTAFYEAMKARIIRIEAEAAQGAAPHTPQMTIDGPHCERCMNEMEGAAPRAEGLDPLALATAMMEHSEDIGFSHSTDSCGTGCANYVIARLSRPSDERDQ